MNRRAWVIAASAGAAGAVLQLAGLVLMLAADGEGGLILGAALFLAGSVPLMWAFECYVERKGRNGAWALFSVLGPLGAAVVVFLRNGTVAVPASAEAERERSMPDRAAGAVLTALVTLGFLWAAMRCVAWDGGEERPGRGDIGRNERRASERLGLIARAQERYRAADRDGDGQKGYAPFLVHLWRTVDREGRPVPVGLLPRGLAFAMGWTRAVDGYYYVDLRVRGLPPGESSGDERLEELYGTDKVAELDYAKEWAMTARPAVYGRSGTLTFIVDGSGRVFAKDLRGAWQTRYPHDPVSGGWTNLAREGALDSLQETAARSAR